MPLDMDVGLSPKDFVLDAIIVQTLSEVSPHGVIYFPTFPSNTYSLDLPD